MMVGEASIQLTDISPRASEARNIEYGRVNELSGGTGRRCSCLTSTNAVISLNHLDNPDQNEERAPIVSPNVNTSSVNMVHNDSRTESNAQGGSAGEVSARTSSTETAGEETSIHSTSTPTSAKRKCFIIKWDNMKIAAIVTALLTLILGVIAWTGQQYNNDLTRTSVEIAKYTFCADHENLRATQECKKIMAEAIHTLSLDDGHAPHPILRKRTDLQNAIDERRHQIAEFLSQSELWIRRQRKSLKRFSPVSFLHSRKHKEITSLLKGSRLALYYLTSWGVKEKRIKVTRSAVQKIDYAISNLLDQHTLANATWEADETQIADLYFYYYTPPRLDGYNLTRPEAFQLTFHDHLKLWSMCIFQFLSFGDLVITSPSRSRPFTPVAAFSHMVQSWKMRARQSLLNWEVNLEFPLPIMTIISVVTGAVEANFIMAVPQAGKIIFLLAATTLAVGALLVEPGSPLEDWIAVP